MRDNNKNKKRKDKKRKESSTSKQRKTRKRTVTPVMVVGRGSDKEGIEAFFVCYPCRALPLCHAAQASG
jgi:hypothetical protein